DVKAGGALLATSYWFEGDSPNVASLIDLPSTSSGTLSLASMFWAPNSADPAVQAQSFPGTLTILNSALSPFSTSPVISLAGDVTQPTFLSAGNYRASNVDLATLAAQDKTNPLGQTSQIINSNQVGTAILPAITNGVVGAQPTAAFLENQLALL